MLEHFVLISFPLLLNCASVCYLLAYDSVFEALLVLCLLMETGFGIGFVMIEVTVMQVTGCNWPMQVFMV